MFYYNSLTLSVHVQRGLLYLSCVYVCVCPLIPAASHIGITKERYQRVQSNTAIILNFADFPKKCFNQKLWHNMSTSSSSIILALFYPRNKLQVHKAHFMVLQRVGTISCTPTRFPYIPPTSSSALKKKNVSFFLHIKNFMPIILIVFHQKIIIIKRQLIIKIIIINIKTFI